MRYQYHRAGPNNVWGGGRLDDLPAADILLLLGDRRRGDGSQRGGDEHGKRLAEAHAEGAGAKSGWTVGSLSPEAPAFIRQAR